MTLLRKHWAWALIVTIAISGFLFSSWIAERSDKQLRENLLLRVQIIADSIDQKDVKTLAFTMKDRANPGFVKLEKWMRKLAGDLGCRSLYSVALKDNSLIFGPENLQSSDPDASPPGTIYKNPPEKLRSVFQTLKAITVGPYGDEYGTFVSAFSPVIDPDTGKAILVVGMDVEAADWKWDVISDAALPMSLTFLLVSLLIFYVYLQKTHMILNAHELSLRESEKKYRFLFESMAQGVVYQSSDGRIIDANPAAERILGYNLDQLKEKTSLDPDWEAIQEDGLPYPGETLPAMLAVQTGEPVFHSTMGIKNQQEGKYKWIEVDAVPQFRPGEDKPCQVYTAFEDITERRNTELALRESESQLADIIEFLPDATLVIHRGGKVIAWNKAMERMTGYSASDMIGKGDYEYSIPFYGERRPILIDLVMLPKEELERKYSYLDRRGDLLIGETDVPVVRGEKRFLSGWAHPIYDASGQVVGAIECIRDITEKRNAEKALELSESRYRFIAENAHDVIWTFDIGSGFTYMSPSVEHLRGYSVEEAISQSLDQTLTPESYKAAMEVLEEEMSLEMNGNRHDPGWSRTFELEQNKKDGSTVWTEVTVNMIYDNVSGIKGIMGITRDITERKQSEDAMKEKNQFIDSLLRAIPVAVFYKDKEGRYLGCNDMFTEVMGVTTEQIAGKTVYELWPGELADKYHSMDLDLMRNRGHQVYEFKVKAKDGRIHPVIYAKDVFFDKSGEVAGLLGAFIDITERKRAEDALLASEEKYRELIQNIQAAVVVHGADTRIMTCNRQAQELLGLTEEQMLGKQAIDPEWHFSREDGSAMPLEEYPVMRVLAARKPFWNSVMGVHRSSQMEDIWVLVSAFPAFDEKNELVQIVMTFVDITDRRRAEEDLQKTNQALQAIIDASPVAIFTLDHDLRVTSWSPAAERIFGWTREEAIGRYNPIVPEDKRDEFEALVSGVLSGTGYSHSEVRRQTKDGRAIYVDVSTEPLRDSSGKVVGAVGVIQDITERKGIEEEKKRLEAQLIQAQKMESIGTLAGGVAHDFNNILAAILGYTELAMDDITNPERARIELQEVLKAGNRAKNLVGQILTFSRKTETRYSPLELPTLIKESLKMLRSVIPTTIEIHQELIGSGLVLSDPTQIHQLMMNLCTNAAHAMDEAGGVLSVSLHEVTIETETARELDVAPGLFLRLGVSDTGHGISPEIQDRIFEPYFTTKELGRGTGLGLSVVHGIVKSHGGAITCRSTPGKGTTFDVFLPEIVLGIETPESTKEEVLQRGSERILYIDDEPALAGLAEKILGKLGYDVTTMTSSLKALDVFKANPDSFDLVITDMTMPGMTGDRLAQMFLEIRPDIPVILCTGYSEHISAEKAEFIGIREYIMKPLQRKTIAVTIRKVLDA